MAGITGGAGLAWIMASDQLFSREGQALCKCAFEQCRNKQCTNGVHKYDKRDRRGLTRWPEQIGCD